MKCIEVCDKKEEIETYIRHAKSKHVRIYPPKIKPTFNFILFIRSFLEQALYMTKHKN